MRLSVLFVFIAFIASGLAVEIPRTAHGDDHSKYRSSSPKLWWARRVLTDDFYTSGRLTERQIKYLIDHGFKSIISMFNFTNQIGDDPHDVGDYLVTTNKEKEMSEEYGLYFGIVIESGEEWQNEEMVRTAANLLTNAPKPVLMHCEVGFSATFGVLSAMTTGTLGSDNLDEQLEGDKVFEIGAGFGYKFTMFPALPELITNITGQNVQDPAMPPDVTIPDWFIEMGYIRPVYKNFYVAGQIYDSHLAYFNNNSIGVIVNLRNKVGDSTDPTQGEVTLINVEDGTGTYTGEGRQSDAQLTKNRINLTRENSFISDSSLVNYERRNPTEFGDEIGYNETIEEMMIKQYPLLNYRSMPIGDGLTQEWWDMYGDELVGYVGQEQSILLHDDTGFMSGIISVLAIAKSETKPLEWVFRRLKEMGYPDVDETIQNVIASIRSSDVTSSPSASTTEGSATSVIPKHVFLSFGLVSVFYI